MCGFTVKEPVCRHRLWIAVRTNISSYLISDVDELNARIFSTIGDLQQKDVEQALIYEEKMVLLLKLLSAVGLEVDIEPPSYRQLIVQYLDSDTVRKEVLNTMQVHKIK